MIGVSGMEKQKSLKVNFIMNAILTMSSFIFPLITFPYVSRVLLPVGTGKVSFANSVLTYFAMFAQLGIPTYGIRACSKVRDNKEELNKTVHEIFLINLIMSVLTYLVFLVCLVAVPRFRQDYALFLILSSTLFFNVIGMEWMYKALEQYTYIAIRSIIFKILGLVIMFAFVREQKDYVIYGGITIFAAVGSNIFNFINAHKYISMKPLKQHELKRHMKPILTFFAMSVATTVYTNLDVAMLGFIKDDAEVGFYNAAVRIKTILVSMVTSLGTVLLPRASYYIENNMKEEFLLITKKALNFVLIVATPMMLYFMLYASDGIYLLSGTAYTNAILPMQLIMPTLFFIGMSNVLGMQMLVPLGRERTVLHSVVAGAVVDLVINILLIPRLGASGAAIGTVVAEAVVWIYQLITLRDMVVDSYKKMQYHKVLAGLVLGTAGSYWVKMLSFPKWEYFFRLLCTACLFFGIYFLFLYITRETFTKEIADGFLGKLKAKLHR